MDITKAIQTRKSIRGYKPDPVPKEILENIIDLSRRAPSLMNTQPWEITVVTGAVLDNIKRRNIEMLASAGFTPYALQGVHRQRQVDLGVQIFQLMGIAREDKERRMEWMQRGFCFFDAPAAIILSVDKPLLESVPISRFDIGAISQNILLAALNYGLGTCVHNQGVAFPEVVKEYAGIPESKEIIICISIGYPDWDFPANKLESKREPVESITTWCGFD